MTDSTISDRDLARSRFARYADKIRAADILIERYAHHFEGCCAMHGTEWSRCNCGFADALEAYQDARVEKK